MNLGIHWQYPWMFCIALIPVGLYLLSKLGLSNLKKFADGHLLPWLMYGQHNASAENKRISSVFYIKISLHYFMWLLLAVAAAGPRQADRESQNRLLNSVDIMVLLDVSRSMQATDIVPNRLARARVELLRLLYRVKGDRVGLIVYGGKSLLVMPPTRDKAVVRFYLGRLRNIDIPVDGSNLLSAVQLAEKVFMAAPVDATVKKRARAILVVSDGEISNQSQGPLIHKKVRSMVANGITFYAMGVGSRAGGTIPDTKQHWLQFNNRLVKSKLNEKRLMQLAATGRGRYALVKNDQTTLNAIYNQGIAKQASYSVDAGKQKYLVWKNLYAMPLLLGVFIMLLLLMPVQLLKNIFTLNRPNKSKLNEQEDNPSSVKPDKQAPSVAVKMSVLILMLSLSACSSPEQVSFEQAKKLYLAKQYSQSLDYYNNLDLTQLKSSRRYQARMAAGSSAYRLAKWNVAVIWFQRAFLDAVSNQQKAQALFNMANAWAKAQNYPLAIQIYRDALTYAPLNRAQINLKLVTELYKNISSDPGYDFAVTSRLGKGPRSRRAIPGLKINKGSTSIDNSPEKKDESGKGYSYDLGDNKSSNKLRLKKPANQTRIAKDTLDNVIKLALYELKQKISATNKNPKIMWRRLFFYENKLFIPKGERVTFPQDRPW